MLPGVPDGLEWHHRPGRHVERYAYDEENARLYVIFSGGSGGYYSRFPPALYGSFLAAESKGKFVSERLKGNILYPWEYLAHAAKSPSPAELKAPFKCRSCGAVRTLPKSDAVMPEHKRKGGSKYGAADCVGSGTYGDKQAPGRK